MDSYLCFGLVYFTQCLTSFSSIDHLLHCYAQFLILFHLTDEVLSINPSANVFVFGDFNTHYKDWLTYSGGTDRPGELCCNFSISKGLTQIVNFPTPIPAVTLSPALLDLYISSDASICSVMAFPPLGNYFTFQKTENRISHFIAWLLTILMLIGMVFVII